MTKIILKDPTYISFTKVKLFWGKKLTHFLRERDRDEIDEKDSLSSSPTIFSLFADWWWPRWDQRSPMIQFQRNDTILQNLIDYKQTHLLFHLFCWQSLTVSLCHHRAQCFFENYFDAFTSRDHRSNVYYKASSNNDIIIRSYQPGLYTFPSVSPSFYEFQSKTKLIKQ